MSDSSSFSTSSDWIKGYKSFLSYPHPAFSYSTFYMPTDMRSLFRWCEWIFYNIPIIRAVITKKLSYVIVDKIYSCKSAEQSALWKRMMEKVLCLKEHEATTIYHLELFGNAYSSILFPHQRFLECKRCGHSDFIHGY